ncbi:hypothetical protein BT96DRAFT_981217 [Gymnopus androsaceus JB14]|uniref:4a-hydroxytetrahydrobiopterin dehydratase n=1 Tax=Gymnopus androsaceus JB14 TaxID=1447944 RepID=A0A6A4GRP4_9AGAR|nr:hypothetical protein BT96DRAFT_981217 [Gymnopus androsaceus JB14]
MLFPTLTVTRFRVLSLRGTIRYKHNDFTTVQTQEHVAALLPIPPRPKTRPTPWLLPDEMEKYLIPLRERIPFRPTTVKQFLKNTERGSEPSETRKTLGNGLIYFAWYSFPTLERGQEFIEGVKEIAQKEKHHPSLLRLEQRQQPISKVFINIHTHEAYIPKAVSKLRPDFPAREATPFPETLIVPGLTMRDVRFAMLVDELFRSNESSDDSIPSLVMKPRENTPTVSDLVQRIFRYRFCPCCGLPHPLVECTAREVYKPKGGGEWEITTLDPNLTERS